MAAVLERVQAYNTAQTDFDLSAGELKDFGRFLRPLHEQFSAWQQRLLRERALHLTDSLKGYKPEYLPESKATASSWQIELPDWCADQRNQMTGPADDAEMVVKMLNSGAPGVMLDLEDSMANTWENLQRGLSNVCSALEGRLTYFDQKRQAEIGIKESATVIWTRPRGLHVSQAGVIDGELISASLFDVASIVYRVDPSKLKHPLAIYIPKSESADEAIWWSSLFEALAESRGWPSDYIKCMALVEAHPLAYQMEEFLFGLRNHILGLNLGRWDYMASLIHFNLNDPDWVLPDRNTIPFDVPFFQSLRESLVDVCHRHRALAIGGMTALFPSRTDGELNERAMAVLAADKHNEASCLMDGAWTGHPDQNAVAVEQFPYPNQASARRIGQPRHPDLRPVPTSVGRRTVDGTRAAVRTVIRYRNGVLNGKGASLLDGYMEDLATDRIYRLMIAQRMRHSSEVDILDERGKPVRHDLEFIYELFDQELARLVRDLTTDSRSSAVETLIQAREISQSLILNEEFDPI